MKMDVITERDVLRLANAMSVKCDLNIKLDQLLQCSSDFFLTLYNAVMGELPIGILADCTTYCAQEHNMACVIDTLADDYLHVDLSHISPRYIVAGDPTTIYNLLEILDGLFEFMLDQISNGLNSGDEGDIDSDVMSEKHLAHTWGPRERRYDSDTVLDSSTNTAELIALDKKMSHKESGNFMDDEKFVPLEKSTSPDVEWHELKSVTSISEHTLGSTDFDTTVTMETTNDRTESLLRLAETQVKQLGLSDADKPSSRSIDKTDEPETLRSTYKVDSKVPEREFSIEELGGKLPQSRSVVVLESSDKGSGISVSDMASDDTPSAPPSVVLEDRRPAPSEKSSSSIASSSGVDEPDGIPKPVLDEDLQSISSIEKSPGATQTRQQRSPQRDWVALLNNLQKTVDESRKIREKYFVTPQTDSLPRDTGMDESFPASQEPTESQISQESTRPKSLQRNVRFEDTISTKTAKELKEFREVLQREKELQNLKNKVLSESYRDHFEEVEESERDKMKPLMKKAQKTERDFNSRMKSNRKPVKKSGVKKDLVSAAKWKSWQSPVVRKTPRRHPIPADKRIRGNLEIGEHDLLPLLISEFPGLQLSSHLLNNAWKKQFRQIEVLTSRESQHQKAKRHNEKQLQATHNRHQLLTDIMRREHEHTQRVRDAKERQSGRREAQRTVKDKRQQSARVRRYYRDYQLQMRARMLKRRTKEERLFRNLFEEGLEIQRSRLRELRKYAQDKREVQQTRQKNEIASLENYYKDQFAILAETLDDEKKELRVRDKAQTELLRKMKSGLRQKMEREISDLQERITRDDEEVYFRELEADRIRRQLQLATYNAKFDSSLAKSM